VVKKSTLSIYMRLEESKKNLFDRRKKKCQRDKKVDYRGKRRGFEGCNGHSRFSGCHGERGQKRLRKAGDDARILRNESYTTKTSQEENLVSLEYAK